MFDNIDGVNWRQLRQAHGSAEHVPSAIKNLTSADAKTRETAYWQLDNHVVLQSGLYEAAFYVIPFLVEILEGDSEGCDYAYDLLFEIANGCAAQEIKCFYGDEELELGEACRAVISEFVPIYLQEVTDVNSMYREQALSLLKSLPKAKGKIIPVLSEIISREGIKSGFGAKLNEAIANLSGL